MTVCLFLIHAHDHAWTDKSFSLATRMEATQLLWTLALQAACAGSVLTAEQLSPLPVPAIAPIAAARR